MRACSREAVPPGQGPQRPVRGETRTGPSKDATCSVVWETTDRWARLPGGPVFGDLAWPRGGQIWGSQGMTLSSANDLSSHGILRRVSAICPFSTRGDSWWPGPTLKPLLPLLL